MQESPCSAGTPYLEDNLVFFQNNLFKDKYPWMKKPFTVPAPVIADPQFANAGGDAVRDYIPKNAETCSQGVNIGRLPGDEIGLTAGFDVKHDILGNEIDPSRPFIGAIRPH